MNSETKKNPRKIIAKKEDWSIEEMPKESECIELNRVFTEEDIYFLHFGNIPKQMEDKWFWYVEDNKLFAHRSWTGFCIFILELDKLSNIHKVIINRKQEQYKSVNIQEDIVMINNLLDYWTKPDYDYYLEWIDETISNIKKNNIVKKYLETKEKHDREFSLKAGGDGDQLLRDKKREQLEVPLLKKMTEKELHEVMKYLNQFERMWIVKNFIKKNDSINETIKKENTKIKIPEKKFYCEVYQGMISQYDCDELRYGFFNDGIPPLMNESERVERKVYCKLCTNNLDFDEYDPLWNGDELMKEKEEQQSINNIQNDVSSVQPIGLDNNDIFLLNIKVAGTNYIDDKIVIIEKLKVNEQLFLVREPENKYDEFAIKVTTSSNKKIGYIPRENNKIISRLLDAGKELYLIIKDIQKENYLILTWLFLKEN